MSQLTSPPRIVIVGGGVSGTLVAVHLLRHAPPGTLITLVERTPPIGRGVAYATNACAHLLNVPVERMSAFPDRPDHFLEWVRQRVGRAGFPAGVARGDFLPRCRYGEYIGYVLTEARQQADPSISFTVRVGEVYDLDELAGGRSARVYLTDGTTLVADQVVLALGNLPGEYPVRSGRQVYKSWRYVHVPWTPGVIDGIDPDAEVLIAGQGLTATDIVIQLTERGHRGRISCLSRRGLRPLPHLPGPAYRDFFAGETAPATVRGLVHRVRAEVRVALGAGFDWRAVIDAIRPHSQRLWAALDWSERARFMRHVRPYWEVHRHRHAPAIETRLNQLVSEGRLQFLAGRFQHLEETPEGLRVTWRPRGGAAEAVLNVAKLVNCTGPRTDYSKYQHPLFVNLLARGLIDHDPLALGIVATPDGRVRRYRGAEIPWLYTLGAPLKGVVWESTSIPEIRVQAQLIGGSILAPGGEAGNAASRFQVLVAEVKNRIVEVEKADLAVELESAHPPLLIDVREPEEVAKGAIPSARHIPRGLLEGRIEDIAPNPSTPIVLYCAGGNRSALAADNLGKMGYTRVRSLAGGYGAWVKQR
ncbi:MAG: FAD/NAD(P)-binding protein [Verrucomicrobia bacterium]|nr:FAD/NAD(P)-binding protein [Verrucomicrobiota bacterium]